MVGGGWSFRGMYVRSIRFPKMGIEVPAGRVSVMMMISCPSPAGVIPISFQENEPSWLRIGWSIP